jgi:UDP-glucose 4-epimerase
VTFSADSRCAAVIHFAGLKAVGESVEQPLRYYRNNLGSTLNLCQVMQEQGDQHRFFIFRHRLWRPGIRAHQGRFPLSCTNPYGRSKLMNEEILRDLHVADSQWNVVLLRYFNPVGAHISGRIGEDPNGIPNNLVPYIAQVAIGKLPNSRFSATITPPPTVPAYATIFMLSIWHRTSTGSGKAQETSGSRRSIIWAQAEAIRFWR